MSAGVKALRGLREGVVIWKHALKNALPPIVTVLGLQLASAFTGLSHRKYLLLAGNGYFNCKCH